MAGDDPVGQLLATVDVLDMYFNRPDFFGCMFMNTADGVPNQNDPVHQAAAVHRGRACLRYRNLAIAAGAESKTPQSSSSAPSKTCSPWFSLIRRCDKCQRLLHVADFECA